MSETKTYSVKEITRLVKQKLEFEFSSIWIEGEISNLKQVSSGHVYFTLKDEFSQISAVMFRSSAMQYITSDIINGVKVKVFGGITVYEKAGNYQILCTKLEKVGLGDLQLKFLELKEKLFKMGWFDRERKKELPFIPDRIAIVTSKTGAAVRDMLNIIYTRWPNMHVVVYPVKVQGEGAKEEIASAINTINEYSLASVIIAGRGGGSIEDLWAFNEFEVAKAIYESKIPVISAVGHEIDFTIADFVADYRAETPSSAAHRVVPDQEKLLEELSNMKDSLKVSVLKKLELLKSKLNNYKNHYCFREPINIVRQYSQRIDDLNISLNKNAKLIISAKTDKIKSLKDLLTSLSPFQVLKRGYSITNDLKTGKNIKNTNDVKIGQEIVTILSNGKFKSLVNEI